jgi:HAD superfamily hydrolase (TIGR01450 family)
MSSLGHVGAGPTPCEDLIGPGGTAALERLAGVKGFVFDMDGTLVLGDPRNHGFVPLAGALEITNWLAARQVPFVVFTNGTARPPAAYAANLADAGFRLAGSGLLTPASAAAELFTRRKYRRVLVLGGEGLRAPLLAAGIEVLPPAGEPRVDAVLIGWYREFTMDALEAACHAVWNGARVYSASQTRFFATADGRALATSRAIAAMIRDMTGCRIHVIGKPSLDALRCAGRRLGVKITDLAVVGDDPSLEVPMAHRGRALAIAVNTGLGSADSFARVPVARRPHITVPGVGDLLALCRRAATGVGAASSSVADPDPG